MTDPKGKKKQEKEKDTDFTDELGGGEDDVLTKEEFFKVLDRAIDPPKEDEKDKKGG